MSKFSSFLTKYAGEIRSIASMFGSIVVGVALDPRERQQANDTIEGLRQAADSIEASIKDIKGLTEIKISKKEIEDAVKATLPSLVAALVAKGVADELAKRDAK